MVELILSIAISSHVGIDGEFNNIHPRITLVKDQYIAGAYYNSESHLSVFLGKTYRLYNTEIETGLVTGYSGADVVPMIKLNYNNFFAAPGYANGDAGLVVGYEVKF